MTLTPAEIDFYVRLDRLRKRCQRRERQYWWYIGGTMIVAAAFLIWRLS